MTATDIERITRDIAAPLMAEPGALLPILHALQDHFSCIPVEAVPTLAQLLRLSRAEIQGVISFYDRFSTSPCGQNTLYICRAESCQAMGSAAVEEAARAHLGIDYNQTSADGHISLQAVYCLGNCACSPAVMVNETLYSRVTANSLTAILDQLTGQKA